jgi:hypothetical protein
VRRALAGLIAVAVVAARAGGQEALLPNTGWGTGIAVAAWGFSKDVAQSGGGLQGVTQVAVPFRLRALFGRWTVDLSGAGAAGAAFYKQAQDSSSDEGDDMRVVSLYGPTDLKLRFTGPVVGDNLIVTLGLNLPTGKVGLNSDETLALQVLGAPALQMPVATLGTGAGATVGAIRAFDGEDWAIAIGASVEQRSEYSPLALLLETGKAETRIAPGMATHVTLGLDRTVGESRMSVLLAGDLFSPDRMQLVAPTGPEESKEYQLGPQLAVLSRLDLAASAWRESAVTVNARYRGEFKDSLRARTSGSSGTYFDASIGGVRGGPEGRGLVIGLDGRWHSGLKFTDALVGAAATAVGLSLGWETLRTSSATRVVLRGEYASFDTGKVKTTGLGVTLGVSVGARREAQ